ncbi:MAG: DUF1801 domain-containing protein [Caldilineaceae bacterium]|nr:DUF1801 domain-containing protein [Caldilineaceae bacterium]
MHIEASDVADYIDKCPARRQDALRRLRDLVLSIDEDVVENLEYGMPTYRTGGQVLCAFASQKRHMSLYLDVDLLASHRAAFGKLNCGKSCVRFTSLDRVPLDTVAAILTETRNRQAQAASAA